MKGLENSLRKHLKNIPFKTEFGGYEKYEEEEVFFIHYPLKKEKQFKDYLCDWVSKKHSVIKDGSFGVYKSVDDYSSRNKGWWTYVVTKGK